MRAPECVYLPVRSKLQRAYIEAKGGGGGEGGGLRYFQTIDYR